MCSEVVSYAVPCRIVSYDDAAVVTYLAPRTIVPRPRFFQRDEFFQLLASGDWEYEEFEWYNHHLQHAAFDRASAVTIIWNEDWNFLCSYINLQQPLRRTSLGYDTFDQILDIVVYPDRKLALEG